MKNPNGPSIEDVDDWNDSLRDKLDADTTRNILLDAVDSFEAKQLDNPELCGNCLKPYSEHYPDLKCVGKGGATTWFPKRIADALKRGKRRIRSAQIALGNEHNNLRRSVPDLRVNDIERNLLADLKIIAIDQQLTLRQLVIDVLSAYRNKQKGSK